MSIYQQARPIDYALKLYDPKLLVENFQRVALRIFVTALRKDHFSYFVNQNYENFFLIKKREYHQIRVK